MEGIPLVSRERFSDDMAPRLVAEAPGYAKTPAGPMRKAALRDSAGVLLGHVWTDDTAAAGWLPADPTPAVARAGAYVWRVLSVQHQRGKPARHLLDPRLFAPLYTLDEPES